MKYKFAVKVVGILLMMLITAGCWDSHEINDLNLLTVVAVDPGKQKNLP